MLIILLVVVSLSLIIFFHEFGHFVLSKIFGVKVEEFGFGYPPRLMGLVKIDGRYKFFWGKKIGLSGESLAKVGTIYSINWIPFGGFNKLKGEEAGSEKSANSFQAKPWWQKSIIAMGGAGMNIFLAIILLSFVSTFGSYQEITPDIFQKGLLVKDINIQVIAIKEASPAEKAGLKIGDKILAINGETVDEIEEVQNLIKDKIDEPVKIKIAREKSILEIEVVPQSAQKVFGSEETILNKGAIGIAMAKIGRVYYPLPAAIVNGFSKTFLLLGQIFQGLYLILRELFVHQKMIGETVGVVGLAVMISEAAQIGLVYLAQFLATISLLIAVTQIIPIPALDGGRILFCIIEGIRGKPIKPEIENKINSLAFTLLLILMVYITYKDLMRLGERFFK